MESRTKYLLIGLLGLLGVYVALPLFENTILAPITDRQKDIEKLDSSLERHNQQIADLLAATKQMKDWKAASLPSNPLAAMRLYQEWVTDMAHLCELSGIDVRPGQKVTKRGVYTAVQVALKADGTFDQVVRFLYHFNRVNLKQRVVSIDLVSEDNQGNPLLEVAMTLEGLALDSAENRNSLFPIATLTEAVSDDEDTLTVSDASSFPATAGFEVRIGSEFLTVTAVEAGKWTVDRAARDTSAADHASNAEVHLMPVRDEWMARTFDDFRKSIVDRSPFALPAPPVEYEPRLRTITDKRIRPGGEVSFRAALADYDPALGSPMYRLKDAPEGMAIDAASGDFKWTAADDQAPGDLKFRIEAFQPEREKEVFATTATIKIDSPNSAPILKLEDSLSVYFGTPVSFTAEAEDPDDDSKFTYSLGDGAPEGAVIDSATGKFEWTPPEDADDGIVEVKVKVTDDGQPALSDEKTVKIELKDDIAQYTKLVMCLSEGNSRTAWLLNQYENQRMELREGDTFTLGDLNATVVAIGKDFMMLQDKTATWELDLGNNLRQLRKLPFLSEGDPSPESAESKPVGKPDDAKPDEDKSDADKAGPAKPDAEKSGESKPEEGKKPPTTEIPSPTEKPSKTDDGEKSPADESKSPTPEKPTATVANDEKSAE